MESKKAKSVETERRVVVARGWRWGEWVMVAKGYKLPVLRLIGSGDLMYSLLTTVPNTVLYTWKLLRE